MVYVAENVRIGLLRMTDDVSGYTFGDAPTVSTVDLWPNVLQTLGGIVDQIDWKEVRARGAGRDYHLQVEGKHMVDGATAAGILQNGLWPAMAMGRERVSGTDSGAGASDLDGAVLAGATTLTLTSEAGYAVGEFIEIEDTDLFEREVRVISALPGANVVNFVAPLRFAHPDATPCNEVAAPFTHTISADGTIPVYTMEVNQIGTTTTLSTYTRGMVVDSLEISGGEEDYLSFSAGIKGQRTTRNTGALSTITSVTTAPYVFDEATFTYDMPSGNVLARVKDFTWSVQNNGKLPAYHNSAAGAQLFPLEYIAGPRGYTLDTTVIPNEETRFFDQLLTAASNLTCTILYTRATGDTFTITNSNCILVSAPHDIPEELDISVPLSFIPQTVTFTVVTSIAGGELHFDR